MVFLLRLSFRASICTELLTWGFKDWLSRCYRRLTIAVRQLRAVSIRKNLHNRRNKFYRLNSLKMAPDLTSTLKNYRWPPKSYWGVRRHLGGAQAPGASSNVKRALHNICWAQRTRLNQEKVRKDLKINQSTITGRYRNLHAKKSRLLDKISHK